MYKIAAIVGNAGLQLVRHRGGRDEIATPDLHGVDADGAGGAVVQPEFDELLDFPQEVDVVRVCDNDGSRNPIRSAAFIGAIHFDRRWN